MQEALLPKHMLFIYGTWYASLDTLIPPLYTRRWFGQQRPLPRMKNMATMVMQSMDSKLVDYKAPSVR